MRVILLGSAKRRGVLDTVEQFRPEIAKYCTIVAEDFYGEKKLEGIDADLAIVFGGDGSILCAAAQMGARQLPVLSVNLGTLGFLAAFTPEMLLPTLRRGDVFSFPCERYLMLKCQHWHNGRMLVEKTALNEVAVQSGPPYRILEVELKIDEERITTYHCDGLIISTPVGSTARNLSAGGPILKPDVEMMAVTPICAHKIYSRAIVISAMDVVTLKVARDYDGECMLALDGWHERCLSANDEVTIRRSQQYTNIIKTNKLSFFDILRQKMVIPEGTVR